MIKNVELKYHKEPLEIIEKFIKPKLGHLISKKEIFNGKIASFQLRKKEFAIEFNYDFFLEYGKRFTIGTYHKEIKIRFDETVYRLKNLYLGNYTHSKATGIVNRIDTISFSDKRKYYYQVIIPLERKLEFHYAIEQTPFSTDLGYTSVTGTTAVINGITIKVYCITDINKKHFFVLDSYTKQGFNDFVDTISAVKVAVGYLSGYYAGDLGFFFAYIKKEKKEPKHFRCISLRDTIRGRFNPISSYSHRFLFNNRSLAKKYQPILRPLSLGEFSLLCEKIYNSIDFSSVLMLILESSVASLLFMPGGFAIALETISDLIMENMKIKLAPIKDKTVSKNIKQGFSDVLDNNCSTLSHSDIETLKRRIDNINQPTNKARLKAPFDILNISLLEEDLKILETRNDFLHGRVPDLTNAGKYRSSERMNKDLFYCSLRFYTLLNVIILKWVGYDNMVVNYPKIHEGSTEIHINEEPYRKVQPCE